MGWSSSLVTPAYPLFSLFYEAGITSLSPHM